MIEDISQTLDLLSKDEVLTADQMEQSISIIMEGKASNDEIAALLTTLSRRGETVDEIVGAAKALRKKATHIKAPANSVDCCGTGGDGQNTVNVSTAVSFVAAACEIPVAKHGNRSSSSKSGAADCLEALGINLDITANDCEEALRDYNFAFLMAPNHHKAMKHVKDVRKQLGFRTIFNLIGPLANPANTKNQLIGVYHEDLLMPFAEALEQLGTENAWVVHGSDGLDEITVTGTTKAVSLTDGKIEDFVIEPTKLKNITTHSAGSLRGGDATYNASAFIELMDGVPSAYRDIAVLNAAAVCVIAGQTDNLEDGISLTTEVIDNGVALGIFEQYRDFTQQKARA